MEGRLLGLDLAAALDALAAAGESEPGIEYTRAPRGESQAGTLRVVRQEEGRLVVARFPDRVREET